MIDEAAGLQMYADAYSALVNIESASQDIRDLLVQQQTAAPSPASEESEATTEEVQEVSADLTTQQMHEELMQSSAVTNGFLVAILCAVLLSVGVQLYRCFAQFWRSK